MNTLYRQAKADFEEFRSIFDGIEYAEVRDKATGMGLSFGAQSDEVMTDINFKHILATCINKDGKSKVSIVFEVYDEDGVYVDTISL